MPGTRSTNWRSVMILALVALWWASAALHAQEPSQPPGVDRTVASYVASLKNLRGKPLRIKAETVSLSRVSDYRLSQTLFMKGDSVRLEQLDRKGDNVSMRRETRITDGQFVGARQTENDSRVSLTSYVKTPSDRFNRTVAPLLGADYLGIAPVLWRGRFHDLAQVLPTLKCATRRDRIGDVDVVLLEGTSEDVVLKLWLAPSLNFGVKRIEYRPTVPNKPTDADIDRIPTHSLYTCEFDDFQKIGDVYLPKKIRIHSVTTPWVVRERKVLPGKSIDSTRETIWTAEVLNDIRKGDFEIAMQIPDETPVHMTDAPHLEFVWRHGAIVAVTEESLKGFDPCSGKRR